MLQMKGTFVPNTPAEAVSYQNYPYLETILPPGGCTSKTYEPTNTNDKPYFCPT